MTPELTTYKVIFRVYDLKIAYFHVLTLNDTKLIEAGKTPVSRFLHLRPDVSLVLLNTLSTICFLVG